MWRVAFAVVAVAGVAIVAGAHRMDRPSHVMSAMIAELCGQEAPFLAENQAAMDRMMNDMNIIPSGDVDRDFAAMMIAHHQGAIEMAQAELRHGKNERLRRIAQGIIIEQQQEIAAMRLALGLELPEVAPSQSADLASTGATSRSDSRPMILINQ